MKKILFIAILVVINLTTFAQLDSTFYYNPDGTKHWWHIQKDVLSFRCINNQQYSGTINPSIVGQQSYWAEDARKMNEVHFNSNCTPFDQASTINQVRTSPDFDMFAYAVTETPNVPCDLNTYYTTDDLILVVFKNPPTLAELSYLNQAYDLDLINSPSTMLVNPGKHTYVFKVNVKQGDLYTSFEICQQIFQNEPNLIYSAEPNMYNRNGQICTVVDEMNLSPGGTQGTWFIRNTGAVVWNSTNGTNDADADICECWSEGYTGANIKVAAIDAAILELDHPDLENITKAYNTTTSTEEFSNFALNTTSHSMNVLSVMGATPNNSNLGQRFAVGAAYGADIYAYIGSSVNSADIISGLQEALIDNVDVINMSFRIPASAALSNELDLHVLNGRADASAPNGAWGTVLVAGTGNDDLSASNFPANHPNVIGVGGSNPNDYRSSSNPPDGISWTQNTAQGSTYGPPNNNYDVVAPMELIMTTDAVNGGSAGNYNITSGTSFSSPIVASIAAMILEKNSNLTYTQVRQAIRDGAEKVRPTNYDYNAYPTNPGYNDEMFYGRVSCSNSIAEVTVSIDENSSMKELVVLTGNNSNFEIILPENMQSGNLKIYTIDGSLVEEHDFNDTSNSINFNLLNRNRGIYLVVLENKDVIWGMTRVVR